jgi:hypothetical protein
MNCHILPVMFRGLLSSGNLWYVYAMIDDVCSVGFNCKDKGRAVLGLISSEHFRHRKC